MYNVLIVDDDKEIVNAIAIYLKNEGYKIYKAYDGNQAVEKLKEQEIHLIILDIMMPEKDGIETLEEIRKEKTIPVIMLELIARVNSNIRRYTKLGAMSEKKSEKKENVYQTGELILDDETKKVTSEGKEIKLTATEFKILKFLMKNKGKVYSIPEIYENVWKEESYGAENIIAVHIRHIREKIEINPKEPKYLKVIWGIGYKIEDIK